MKKITTTLTNPHYNTPKTSLLTFQFEPIEDTSPIRSACIQHFSIEDKDIYLIDGFFSDSETQEVRSYFKQASFSRKSYGSPEAIEKGEQPARSMDSRERWLFFSRPPSPIQKMYQFFGMLGHHLEAEVSTLPWELCDANGIGSCSVIVNFLEKMSEESMELGKHRDCNPLSNVPIGIPNLYTPENPFHPATFVNGAPGKPWLISVMLYVTDDAFLPEYRLGTVFYDSEGNSRLRADCLPMRMVIFEGDIIHSIESSQIPPSVKTWRVSCVFKLFLNPKNPSTSLKEALREKLSHFQAFSGTSFGHQNDLITNYIEDSR